MSKPSDVSERAWAFACERYGYPHKTPAPGGPGWGALCGAARAFDEATAELRSCADALAAYAEYHVGTSHSERATLAAYAPGENK